MNIKVNEPGWENAEVTLNGIPQKLCYYANEEENCVGRTVTDLEGNPKMDGAGFMITEIAYGKVVISIKNKNHSHPGSHAHIIRTP